MLKLRYRNDAPRRPPRVIILGCPGCGKTTQAIELSRRFGLTNINIEKLLKDEATRNPAIRLRLEISKNSGEPLPDEIVLRVLEERLRQSDCRLNGWILDGFPENEAQVNLLKSIRIKPNLVVIMEM